MKSPIVQPRRPVVCACGKRITATGDTACCYCRSGCARLSGAAKPWVDLRKMTQPKKAPATSEPATIKIRAIKVRVSKPLPPPSHCLCGAVISRSKSVCRACRTKAELELKIAAKVAKRKEEKERHEMQRKEKHEQEIAARAKRQSQNRERRLVRQRAKRRRETELRQAARGPKPPPKVRPPKPPKPLCPCGVEINRRNLVCPKCYAKAKIAGEDSRLAARQKKTAEIEAARRTEIETRHAAKREVTASRLRTPSEHDSLIVEYLDLPQKIASQFARKYRIEPTEAQSIAMLALLEVARYPDVRADNFRQLVLTVTKRRLIDCYRVERKHLGNRSLTADPKHNRSDDRPMTFDPSDKCNDMRAIELRDEASFLLSKLGKQTREIVERFYGLGIYSPESCQRIAAAVGVNVQNVKQRLYKAILQMRQAKVAS